MTSTRRGLFITFEGPDGSGKSTQIRLLGRTAARRRPGGTRNAGARRNTDRPADPARAAGCRESGTVPYGGTAADVRRRAQNVDESILPALAKGTIVLSDRFTDSTLAYQGVGRGTGR